MKKDKPPVTTTDVTDTHYRTTTIGVAGATFKVTHDLPPGDTVSLTVSNPNVGIYSGYATVTLKYADVLLLLDTLTEPFAG